MRKPVCGKTRGSVDVVTAVGVGEGKGESDAEAEGEGAGDGEADAARVGWTLGVGWGVVGVIRDVG